MVFFLLSAWSLGGLVVGRTPWSAADAVAALGAASLPPAGHRRLHLPDAVRGAAAGELRVGVRGRAGAADPGESAATSAARFPRCLRLPARLELRTWGERLGCAALLFVLITHWFAMLKPEASADGLSMHLAIPANIAANHVMTFDPGRMLWAVMPMGADFTYSIVYLLGGEMAARLLNFAILLVLLGLLHAAVRRWVSPGVAWLLVALFATTPMVQLVTGSLFVENLLTAFLLGMMTALWRFGESGERRFLYLAAALGGTAMATKFGAIAFLVPALVCAAVEVWRRRKQSGARWGLAARTAAARGGSALRHRVGQDRQSALPVPQRQISLAATRSQGRDSRRALPQSAHLEHAVRPHLPHQSPLRRAGRLVRFSVSGDGAARAAGAIGGAAPPAGGRGRGRASPRFC